MAAKKFKKGDKVEIIGNYSGHGMQIGTTCTVSHNYGNYVRVKEFPSFNFYQQDLRAMPTSFDKKALDKQKAELKLQINLLESKIAYLDETGQDEGNEKEFRIYQTMSLFENNELTKQQKAKAIASLLEE